jgi:hypothetical protein
MQAKTYWLPKRGHSDEEYEDAFADDAERGRFAVADGATESSYAGRWAKLLVQGFVREPACLPRKWGRWLQPIQQEWLADVGNRPLPWYAENKVKDGAFATFLGLVIKRTFCRSLCWQAIAVGDSCLFHLRDGALLEPFPITQSSEFGNSPWLVGSRSPLGQAQKSFRIGKGRCKANDRFWLMTDALAQWFLREHEAGRRPWDTLEGLLAASAGNEAFASWVRELRDSEALRNDDVTLVAVSL